MRRDILLWVGLGILGVAALALVTSRDGMVVGLPAGDFAGLAFYGALLIVLGSSIVIGLRMRLGETLKNLGIWAAIFLVVIGVYAFAPEFESAKNRVLAVLMPGTLISLGQDGEGTQYMAVRGSDGHFHLSGEIDGTDVSLMVDTGASVIAMDRPTAQALGIDTDRLNFSDRVMTANGVARSAPVFLDTVRIGDIVRHDVRAAVTDNDNLGTILLGLSFLNTLTSYDFRGDRLVLTD